MCKNSSSPWLVRQLGVSNLLICVCLKVPSDEPIDRRKNPSGKNARTQLKKNEILVFLEGDRVLGKSVCVCARAFRASVRVNVRASGNIWRTKQSVWRSDEALPDS